MKSSSTQKIDIYDVLLALVSFVSALAIYTRTLTPGLLHGDSGEFQTLAYLLGHTHPTGYPIYLLLAKLLTFLPLGDVAYRVNLFSAFMGALTVAGIYLSGRLLVKYRAIAFIGASIITEMMPSRPLHANIVSVTGCAIIGQVQKCNLRWKKCSRIWGRNHFRFHCWASLRPKNISKFAEKKLAILRVRLYSQRLAQF